MTTRHLTPVDELLDDLRSAPDLAGAACVCLRTVFDRAADNPTDERNLRIARRVCASCPVVETCSAWVTSLPKDRRPFGVTAGTARLRAP